MANVSPLITLTTDFGTADTFVAQMKGVILGIAPQARIVDITHHIPPQDVTTAALALDDTVDAFADGAIHVVVVDPGVGGSRAAIAVRTDRFTLIGPDNGVFSAVLARHTVHRGVTLTNPAYHRHPTSATFHGRDIFAPVAGHLAAGCAFDDLGKGHSQLVTLDLPAPKPIADGLELRVLRIDHFGNLLTNLKQADCPAGPVVVQVGMVTVRGIRRTFADVSPGDAVAYFGSGGRLEIAVRNGDAAAEWRVKPGDPAYLRVNAVR